MQWFGRASESDASSCVLLIAARIHQFVPYPIVINTVFRSSFANFDLSPVEYHVNVATNQRSGFRTLSICATINIFWIPVSQESELLDGYLRLNYPGETCFHLVMIFQSSKPPAILFRSLALSIYAWHRHAPASHFPSSKLGLESLLSLNLSLSPYLSWPQRDAFIEDEIDCGYPL